MKGRHFLPVFLGVALPARRQKSVWDDSFGKAYFLHFVSVQFCRKSFNPPWTLPQ